MFGAEPLTGAWRPANEDYASFRRGTPCWTPPSATRTSKWIRDGSVARGANWDVSQMIVIRSSSAAISAWSPNLRNQLDVPGDDAMPEVARRAGLIVPPVIEEVWVSAEGAALDEDDDAAYFAALPFDPSDSAGDVALFGPALRHVAALVGGRWEDTVRGAVEAGRQAAAFRSGLEGKADARIASARRDAERRIGLLEGRPDGDPLIERERTLANLIEQAVASPKIQLVALHFVVLTEQAAPTVPRRPTIER